MAVDPPISHRDVTTVMALLGDIQTDVRRIRDVLDDDDSEREDAPEDDT